MEEKSGKETHDVVSTDTGGATATEASNGEESDVDPF